MNAIRQAAAAQLCRTVAGGRLIGSRARCRWSRSSAWKGIGSGRSTQRPAAIGASARLQRRGSALPALVEPSSPVTTYRWYRRFRNIDRRSCAGTQLLHGSSMLRRRPDPRPAPSDIRPRSRQSVGDPEDAHWSVLLTSADGDQPGGVEPGIRRAARVPASSAAVLSPIARPLQGRA